MNASENPATWKPTDDVPTSGSLNAAEVRALPESAFAFPRLRKEPMTDASHVRSALARFNQVSGASDADRDLAFANIKKAAGHFSIHLSETDWRRLGPVRSS
jgi:hypothetical protein